MRVVKASPRLVVTTVVILATTSGFLTGCRHPAPAQAPLRRVIILDVDTLRADFLGCSGGAVDTPNIDRLAARGVRFTHARSHIPITGPSHSSLFTGVLPTDHGVLNNTQILAPRFTTLAETAAERGMQTAAFITLGVLNSEYGIAQGFDVYDQQFKHYSWVRRADEVNRSVMKWTESEGAAGPFLLWVHYSDPHSPYAAPGRPFPKCDVSVNGTRVQTIEADGWTRSYSAPVVNGRCTITVSENPESSVHGPVVIEGVRTEPGGCRIVPVRGLHGTQGAVPIFQAKLPATFEVVVDNHQLESIDVRFAVKRHLSAAAARLEYGYEVEFVDREIGHLVREFNRRGWLDDSLIIFTSDHGEGLGDHHLVGHIHQLYDSLLRVPLIVVAPGRVPAGKVVDAPVSLVDVLPTIADLFGWPVADGVRGRSLVPLLEGSPDSWPDRPHFAVTARPQARQDLEAVVLGGWKLIREPATGAEELYDLAADPDESTNVAAQYPERVAALARLLDEQRAEPAANGAWADLDDESRSRLEQLGYITEDQSGQR